jgi:cellobiose-specific phosphotransferase system component IIB
MFIGAILLALVFNIGIVCAAGQAKKMLKINDNESATEAGNQTTVSKKNPWRKREPLKKQWR